MQVRARDSITPRAPDGKAASPARPKRGDQMRLSTGDLLTIALFFAINLGIGLYYARRGGKSLSDFFLSGRSVPWWLAGTSMVATTFAADTPLVVTKLVADNGIAGNWLWWSMAGSGILTVFFFAALWRRSGVLTDVEFIELRYSGKPAAALARRARRLSRLDHQHDHHGLGEPGHCQDHAGRARNSEMGSDSRLPGAHGVLRFDRRPVERPRNRRPSVHREDVDDYRAGCCGGGGSGRHRRAEGQACNL